jgi:NADH-quinone oxidoreductase subunit N
VNPIDVAALRILWLPVMPTIAVAVTAIVVLLAGVRVSNDDSEGLGWLSLAGLVVAFILTLGMIGQSGTAFAGAISIDGYGAYFEIAIIIAAALTILMSLGYAADKAIPGAEYYSLILFSVVGMMLMAIAGDLIAIFIGLETMSIAVYILAGVDRRSPRSGEAAIKYFILGAFSTGFLLYGIALIYASLGTIKLGAIHAALASVTAASPVLILGLGLMMIGFGFKVAAVPFHMWTPDVYEGAPTPITAFMAVGVKIAAFAAFVRVFMIALEPLGAQSSAVLEIIAVLTMTGGNLIAVVQTNIKRMLAYSAIAHAGYILVAMTAGGVEAGGAILYYLLAYALTNLGAFAVITELERRDASSDRIADYRGLGQRRPLIAAAMAIFMLSLTGIPPLAGFVGKFYLFNAAIHRGYVGLVIVAVLNSAVSAYYYLGVIVAMYMEEGGAQEPAPAQTRAGVVAAIALALIGTVIVGVYPQPYMNYAAGAFASAHGDSADAAAAAASR